MPPQSRPAQGSAPTSSSCTPAPIASARSKAMHAGVARELERLAAAAAPRRRLGPRGPRRPWPDLRYCGRRRAHCRKSSSSTSATSSSARRSSSACPSAVQRMRALMDEARKDAAEGRTRGRRDLRRWQRPHRHPPHREDAGALRRAFPRPGVHRGRARRNRTAAASAPPPTPSALPPRRPAPRRWARGCAAASIGATWVSSICRSGRPTLELTGGAASVLRGTDPGRAARPAST